MKATKIVIKKINPLFTRIVTTADRYTEAESMENTGLIDSTKVNALKDIHTVVAIGTSVRFVKPGDKVSLSMSRYAVRKYNKDTTAADMNDHYNAVTEYKVPMITLERKEHLFIDEGDVEFIISDFEELEVEVNLASIISAGKSPIIMPS